MSDDNPILRAVECQVLDRHHLQCKLLVRNANDAIVALLRCYGDVVRGLRTGIIVKNSDDAKSQTANEGFRGLAHCLRWIREGCPRLITVSTPGTNVLAEEALALLRWGVKYDALFNQHTAYSRKINGERMVEVCTNETAKSITFLPREAVDPRFFVSQVEAKKAEDERQAMRYPDEQLAELSTQWYQSVHPGQVKIAFDDSTIRFSGAIEVASQWLRDSCLPELADDRQLGEFTARNLRCVLAAVHVACLFRVKLENVSDGASNPGRRVLTHVLSWRFRELIEWLFQITDVDRNQLSAIVSLLTFDTEPQRVTLAHKPFVLGTNDRVFLSPRLFLGLSLSQVVVGALNLNPETKAAYDACPH